MKRNEKGSITLIVFATVMMILIVLSAILTSSAMKNKSQLIETQKLKNAYDGDMNVIYTEYNS